MNKLIDEKQLKAIAKAIAKAQKRSPSRRQRAGITYLGQFISHDIVPATNQGRQSRHVTPYLDLGSIYGDNDEFLSPQGLFPIRPVRDMHGKIVGFDVPRIRDGEGGYPAIIAEARNDDVLVVTQLHAFFQRLHNAILCSGYAVNTDEAKEFTIKIFQLLVVEEFCKNILDKDVFTSYFEHGETHYNLWNKSEVPAFFSKAAFRFGHSMVRVDYGLNTYSLPPAIRLSKLFTTNKKLGASKAIDWSLFFDETLHGGQPAMPIDTNLSDAMQRVRALDGSFGPIDLILKNLSGGESSRLPTGLEVAEKIYQRSHKNLLRDTELWFRDYSDSNFAKSIETYGGSKELSCLPLWPFILIEAELAKNKRHCNDNYAAQGINECLGRVGSTLVAEVLVNGIASSEFSIFIDGKYDLEAAFESMGELKAIIRPKEKKPFNFMHLYNTLKTIEGK